MAAQLAHIAIDGDEIARVELDKPPVNAFDFELVEALGDVVRELALSGARAAVFSGRGPCFGAGGDIKWMYDRTSARDGKALRSFFRSIQRLFDDVDRLPMPTIASIHGTTLGGGLELALACDLRVAAADTRIGFPEATIGLLPAAGGTQRLTEIVGRGIALELLYTGRIIDMDEAQRLGLVNRVAPAADLAEATETLLSEVLRSTRAALGAAKECVRVRIEDGRLAGFRTEAGFVETLAFDPEAVARLTAFAERKSAPKPPPAVAAPTPRPEGA